MSVFEKIGKMKFDSDNREIICNSKPIYTSERLTQAQIDALPKETKDLNALRCKLCDIFQIKFNENYAQLESRCYIKRDTFQKAVNFKRSRNISTDMLEKICIGAEVSIDEAKELFSLTGYTLNEKNRRDQLFMSSLEAKSTIDEYDADLVKCNFPSIFKE